jgi:sialidase-1
MKIFFLLVMLFSCCNHLHAQQISEEHAGKWRQFEKVEFKIDTLSAFYIKPKKAIAGNPWVWRAHFPNWHTEMDSVLLERGFHIAYINTNNLYGHPKAMMAWDNFYNYLVSKKNFAPKVALEAVSRGGLYAYAWAKRNPSKVSCIYTEAPVCDFTSWPGGKGKGKGSANDWKKLLAIYGLTEEQALNFTDQPKDNLEGLAAFKVPVLHLVGLKDSIVPAEENSFVLVNNYIKSGGPATVVPMTKGEQELNGHHFPIEDPAAIADFIYKNNVPVKQPLNAQSFIYPYGNLKNVLWCIQNKQEVTVAFLGGSITNMNGWRNKVCQYFTELYPDTKFNFINAGIPSLGSVPHAFRLQRDVLDKGKIDLMFIESAVNDRGNGTPEIQQRRAIEGIIRHAYGANPNMNMVLMAFADEASVHDYSTGKIPLEVKVHSDLAKYYHLPFINLAEEVSKRIANKEFTWKDDFKNLHPSPFGQEIYFNAIKTLLRKEFIDNSVMQPVAVKLPPPLQKFNYDDAKYIAIDNAGNKKDFIVDPSWNPADSARTRSGFVNVPMLVGEKARAGFDLVFNGTAVGIATVAGPDAGKINYTIDGKEEKLIDLYSRYSASLHLPQYILLGDELKKGKHVLRVKIADEHNERSKGNAVRIVYFLVNK